MHIEQIEGLANRLLPEGSFKEFLRKQYRRYYNPLYSLAGLITRIDYPGDGSILVELVSGLRLYGPPDQITRKVFLYADRSRLGEAALAGQWSTFLQILSEEYVDDVYGCTQLRQGDVVLDVGAHCGVYAVKAAQMVGSGGVVIAIEPSSENLMLLQRNAQMNGLQNIIPIQIGLWSAKTRLTLRLAAMSGAHTFEHRRTDAPYTERTEDVDVDTLDNILDDLRISKIDFIKMDIEGAEVEALKGMQDTLRANAVKLAIAAYHRIDGTPTHLQVRKALRHLGYCSTTRNGIVYGQRCNRAATR